MPTPPHDPDAILVPNNLYIYIYIYMVLPINTQQM